MTSEAELTVTVNGARWSGTVPARLTLCDFLRSMLRLTGTHVGCEQGVCGACTVLANGAAVRSCLMLAVQAEGADVTTVENGPPGAADPSSRRVPSAPSIPVRVLHFGLPCRRR